MTNMMHSGVFVSVVLAVLILVCTAMYTMIRVAGGRTQSREQAAAMTKFIKTSPIEAPEPPADRRIE